MTNISHEDFAREGLVNEDAAAMFVRADAPWQTLAELEQAIREAPRTLRASGTATAGIWHLALGGWLSSVALDPNDVIWLSIAGSAPSLQELLAGAWTWYRAASPKRRRCSRPGVFGASA